MKKLVKNGVDKLMNTSYEAVRDILSKQDRVDAYRKYAKMNSSGKASSEGFDGWALSRVSRENHYPVEKLKEEILAAEAVDGDVNGEIDKTVEVTNPGQIESILDWALERNLEQQAAGETNFQNVLLEGEAGTGKSSRVKAWAKANNINLMTVRAAGMDDTDLGGALSVSKSGDTVQRLATTEFDKLDRPNSVLFLDEYNRAPKSVRTNLLELVNSHEVPDPRAESGQRFLPNFLFTVAAINPTDDKYDTDTMDLAERTRFRHINVENDMKNTLNHLETVLDRMAEKLPQKKQIFEGRKRLAQALINGGLTFDSRADIDKYTGSDDETLVLNARTFTNAIMGCDGTKKDLIAKWPEYCGPYKTGKVKEILNNYQDVEDEATAAIRKKVESKKKEGEDDFFSKDISDQMLDLLEREGN